MRYPLPLLSPQNRKKIITAFDVLASLWMRWQVLTLSPLDPRSMLIIWTFCSHGVIRTRHVVHVNVFLKFLLFLVSTYSSCKYLNARGGRSSGTYQLDVAGNVFQVGKFIDKLLMKCRKMQTDPTKDEWSGVYDKKRSGPWMWFLRRPWLSCYSAGLDI